MCGEIESCKSSSYEKEDEVIVGNGNAKSIQMLRNLIIKPRLFPSRANRLPRSLLLSGPRGIGKTSLVRAIVKECGANLIIISPNTVHTAHAGDCERTLCEAFSEALSLVASGKSSVIFIDDMDVLCPPRDSQRDKDFRIVSLLCTLMDSSKATSSTPGVVVVASTKRVDAIDPALRRYGHFDIETEVTVPDKKERLEILELYTRETPQNSCDLESIAASCNGYVGSDLRALCNEAVNSAVRRSSNAKKDVNDFSLTMEDWKNARSLVEPSITKGVTLEIPKVTWKDIGGLKDVKKELEKAVEWPMKYPASFSRLGINPIRGILLHGPPGCSKTTLAKAIANAANVPFISLSCTEMISKFVGQGEGYLREMFRKARLAGKSIIFFDEVDAVAGKRGHSSSGNSVAEERVLSTLLTEMDGLEEAKGVLVLAATNRREAIDDALLRPGRLDLKLYVPPPDLEGRFEILKVYTRKMKLGSDVDLRRLAEDTERFTGAELEGLCKEVGVEAIREAIRENKQASVIYGRHFQIVKNALKPALAAERKSWVFPLSLAENNVLVQHC
ncbi:cell division control-like protein [Medicago truncatula]|uniref:Cell division control-like protein n=1 Tax=Medicago truncatula TaxID=3880 RepID=G7L4V5_MEDTR|nr:cell division control-like protein [Medicago truncatula]